MINPLQRLAVFILALGITFIASKIWGSPVDIETKFF